MNRRQEYQALRGALYKMLSHMISINLVLLKKHPPGRNVLHPLIYQLCRRETVKADRDLVISLLASWRGGGEDKGVRKHTEGYSVIDSENSTHTTRLLEPRPKAEAIQRR